MSDKIEIKMNGPKRTPGKFLTAAESFLTLIEGKAHKLSSEEALASCASPP